MIYFQLFLSFVQVGLFSIGGGYASLSLIQAQIVSARAWLTMEEFTDLITIAEMTPGPIAVNAATFVGMRIAGLPGGVAATLGCIFPSCVVVSLLAVIYHRHGNAPALQGVLSGLRPAIVALIAAAGMSILSQTVLQGQAVRLANVDMFALALIAAALFALRRYRLNPILVIVLCGAASLGAGFFG